MKRTTGMRDMNVHGGHYLGTLPRLVFPISYMSPAYYDVITEGRGEASWEFVRPPSLSLK